MILHRCPTKDELFCTAVWLRLPLRLGYVRLTPVRRRFACYGRWVSAVEWASIVEANRRVEVTR